jgi:hypothetical protein
MMTRIDEEADRLRSRGYEVIVDDHWLYVRRDGAYRGSLLLVMEGDELIGIERFGFEGGRI